MLFGKKDHLIGLDIGSGTIKLGEVLQTKRDRTLKKFGMAGIPPGAIVEGRIREPAPVADTIKRLKSELKVKEQNVATSIAGYSVVIKKIVVQKMSDEELQDNIQYEAEQYIPFDVQDVNIDFQILGEHEANPEQMYVMLVAAKTEIVNEYVSLLRLADLNPCVIDVDVFALEKTFEDNYEKEEKSIALIDIGANKMSMNILKDGMSAFTRDVSIGGEQITAEIASRLKCSRDEAEALKLGKSKDQARQQDIQQVIYSVTSSWCGEIRRAIDFYYSTYPDEDITRIILSGGGAQTTGFADALSTETSIEVEMCDPFKTLNINEKQHDLDYLRSIAPQAAVCMGLALRRVGDK
ncbi:MAG: type IV pilus assembly protein PilM [Deltaproteobacteria bacterium]|nr:type IV pilus assembly protein PilM [Deltaproteobacteria bacterium]